MKKKNFRTYVEYKDGRLYEFDSLQEAMRSTITMELHVAGSGCTIREALELIRDYIPQIVNVAIDTMRPEKCFDLETVYYSGKIDEEVLELVG